MKKLLFAAGLVLLAAPALPAFAHDETGGIYDLDHWRNHRAHRHYHEELSEAHRRAHEEGFESSAEHRAYHRYLRGKHEEFHEDHPHTRHDHYRWWYSQRRDW